MSAKRKSSLVARHTAALKAMHGKKVEAGWFESDRYGAEEGALVGRSVAEVARLNEFGGVINQPGGTKYITDAVVKQRFVGSRFVSGDFQGDHSVTGPHLITIPARPFMRLASKKFEENRLQVQSKIAKQLANGKISPVQALGQIGIAMENSIVDSIKNGGWTPNAPSTIQKKGFDKPLIDSAHMWKTVNSKVS